MATTEDGGNGVDVVKSSSRDEERTFMCSCLEKNRWRWRSGKALWLSVVLLLLLLLLLLLMLLLAPPKIDLRLGDTVRSGRVFA